MSKGQIRFTLPDGKTALAFYGKGSVFSNMYELEEPIVISFKEIIDAGLVDDPRKSSIVPFELTFKSSEGLFQFCKATYFGDYESAIKILNATDGVRQKHLAYKIVNFNKANWNRVSVTAMQLAIQAKFRHIALKTNGVAIRNISPLVDELVKTKDMYLIEASPTDNRWGAGLDMNNPLIQDLVNHPGDNLVGKILMRQRDILLQDMLPMYLYEKPFTNVINLYENYLNTVYGPDAFMFDDDRIVINITNFLDETLSLHEIIDDILTEYNTGLSDLDIIANALSGNEGLEETNLPPGLFKALMHFTSKIRKLGIADQNGDVNYCVAKIVGFKILLEKALPV